jgi:hypothetical protein
VIQAWCLLVRAFNGLRLNPVIKLVVSYLSSLFQVSFNPETISSTGSNSLLETSLGKIEALLMMNSPSVALNSCQATVSSWEATFNREFLSSLGITLISWSFFLCPHQLTHLPRCLGELGKVVVSLLPFALHSSVNEELTSGSTLISGFRSCPVQQQVFRNYNSSLRQLLTSLNFCNTTFWSPFRPLEVKGLMKRSGEWCVSYLLVFLFQRVTPEKFDVLLEPCNPLIQERPFNGEVNRPSGLNLRVLSLIRTVHRIMKWVPKICT